MDAARKMSNDGELRRIAAAGIGFVADSFNRRWHLATWPRIRNLTVGQPKWFAPTFPTLDVYLQQRLAQYPTAKPILPCKTCGRSAGLPPAAHSSPLPAHSAAANAEQWPPLIRHVANGFEVWANEYVRNDSRTASSARFLRRLITNEDPAVPGTPHDRQGDRCRAIRVADICLPGPDSAVARCCHISATAAIAVTPGYIP